MKRHRVLIVDDEAYILKALERLLRDEPYEVITCQDPRHALELIEKISPALIISDMRMPGISGLELLKEAKKKSPDALRVVLSGYSDIESIIASINEGEIYRYISKPWDDNDLKLIISHALSHYDLLNENRILLNMVKRQKDVLDEIKEKHPDVADLPSMKQGAYVIEDFDETLEEFMKKYFPRERGSK